MIMLRKLNQNCRKWVIFYSILCQLILLCLWNSPNAGRLTFEKVHAFFLLWSINFKVEFMRIKWSDCSSYNLHDIDCCVWMTLQPLFAHYMHICSTHFCDPSCTWSDQTSFIDSCCSQRPLHLHWKWAGVVL